MAWRDTPTIRPIWDNVQIDSFLQFSPTSDSLFWDEIIVLYKDLLDKVSPSAEFTLSFRFFPMTGENQNKPKSKSEFPWAQIIFAGFAIFMIMVETGLYRKIFHSKQELYTPPPSTPTQINSYGGNSTSQPKTPRHNSSISSFPADSYTQTKQKEGQKLVQKQVQVQVRQPDGSYKWEWQWRWVWE